MKVFRIEELLRELAKRIVVVKAGTCMLVVYKLASQKSRSEGPIQFDSALSSLIAMVLEENHAPESVICHTVSV